MNLLVEPLGLPTEVLYGPEDGTEVAAEGDGSFVIRQYDGKHYRLPIEGRFANYYKRELA